ncbi:hypothetical protein [Serratia quinivorans]|uniref:hypothetical protein n=1 Tax=Serratia quinivorans TaxID=137545 RepID=UPI0034C5FB72
MTEVLTYEALKADRDAQQKRADALAVTCSLYREAISKARRLINVGEMGDADDVLAKAERDLPATDAALAAIRADAMAEGAEACVRALVTSDDDDFTDAPNICAMVARQLREAK